MSSCAGRFGLFGTLLRSTKTVGVLFVSSFVGYHHEKIGLALAGGSVNPLVVGSNWTVVGGAGVNGLVGSLHGVEFFDGVTSMRYLATTGKGGRRLFSVERSGG